MEIGPIYYVVNGRPRYGSGHSCYGNGHPRGDEGIVGGTAVTLTINS
ncbi:MAG: hypothetical protein KBE23_21540 [Chloroflexi bacterium]|nr:hypothetical protein [Chloroflexota bacterium]MBP7045350.1 hypothetical protein [Chloroflexota bacterium]